VERPEELGFFILSFHGRIICEREDMRVSLDCRPRFPERGV
jgi:hypothetical protein